MNLFPTSTHLCQRCHVHAATGMTAGLPMCSVCSAQVSYRHPGVTAGMTATGVDLGVFNPIGLGERAGKALSGNDSSGGASSNFMGTVKSTANTVKTVAIVGGVITGLLLIYVVWKQGENAKETSHHAMRLFAEHPEILAAL